MGYRSNIPYAFAIAHNSLTGSNIMGLTATELITGGFGTSLRIANWGGIAICQNGCRYGSQEKHYSEPQ
jgi:hypothetical protein